MYRTSNPHTLDAMWQFISGFQSVQIATCHQNTPFASYAPVLQETPKFYLYLSQLATHTHNLLHNPQASLLFIENETEANNLFARQRATLSCDVRIIERDSEKWSQQLDKMEVEFGETVAMTRQLPDFVLFELLAQSAHYVVDFAKAYRFEIEES